MCVRCVQVHPCAGVVWVCAASPWSWAHMRPLPHAHQLQTHTACTEDLSHMHHTTHTRHRCAHGTHTCTAHKYTCAHYMQIQTRLHASPILPCDTHGHRTHSHTTSTRTPHSTRRHLPPPTTCSTRGTGLAQTQHVHAEVKGLRTCAVSAGPLAPEDICPCS